MAQNTCKNAISGTAFVYIDGSLIETKPKATTIKLGGNKRTGWVSNIGNYYTMEEAIPSELECEVVMTNDVDIIALNKICGATVTVEFDNGTTFVMGGGTASGEGQIKEGDGTFKLSLMGNAFQKS